MKGTVMNIPERFPIRDRLLIRAAQAKARSNGLPEIKIGLREKPAETLRNLAAQWREFMRQVPMKERDK
jgi:hypothetical protein